MTGSDADFDVEAALRRGAVAFLGLEFVVGPGALVPRPETELLARAAIEAIQARRREPLVIDVCCGVGNLACAIAHHTTARVLASDLSAECAALTRLNAERLGLSGRLKVFEGDLFAPLQGELASGGVDVIVCNPPYISTGRLAQDRAALLEREPREAFDGGPYGLSVHQRVIREAATLLAPGGALLFEFGQGQDRQLAALLARARGYGAPRFVNDAAGVPRVVVATRT